MPTDRSRMHRALGLVWGLSVLGALLCGAVLGGRWGGVVARWQAWRPERTVAADGYDLTITQIRIPGGGRDGGLTSLDDGLLIAGRDGGLWFVDAARTVHGIPLKVPVNTEAFRLHPGNAGLAGLETFGVKDLLAQRVDGGVRLLATHSWFDEERRCYLLRLSVIETTVGALTGEQSGALEDDGAPTWRTAFESWPCLPIGRQADGTRLRPTIGAGGRLATLSDREVLLTLGAFKGETRTDPPLQYWDSSNAYGKTWRVDVTNATRALFSVGHRNPQGLVRTTNGVLWLTEHGARGGDELNLLLEGRNYGFPLVSYGTAYGSMIWPSNPAQGRHEGYEKPRFAWVPSIGISQLAVLVGDAFPAWRGDLVVGSLGAESLFRVRLDGDRVTMVERIPIGHRVRDLIVLRDGALAVKTDDDRLLYVVRRDR